MKLRITWRKGAYYVNIPDWDGGEVVTADEHDAVKAECESLREQNRKHNIWHGELQARIRELEAQVDALSTQEVNRGSD